MTVAFLLCEVFVEKQDNPTNSVEILKERLFKEGVTNISVTLGDSENISPEQIASQLLAIMDSDDLEPYEDLD